MCCVWILAGSISDSRMLCTANKHCSLLCMAMSEMLLLWPVSMLHFTCFACWAVLVALHVLCLDPCSKHIRQQNALHSRQALLSAVHGNAEMLLLWPVSMLHFTCSACWAALVTLHVLCLDPCSRHIRQQHALHSKQALLTAVHGNAEMLLLWPVSMLHFTCYACWAALVTLMCCGWILAASISDSRMLCTANKHCSLLCMAMSEMLLLWPVSMLHFTCFACWAVLVALHVLCLDPSRKHIRQQNALHSKQALLTAVHGNVGDAAAVACVYAAFHVLCMLGCLGHTDVLCLDPCSKHIRQQNALHSRQALLSAVHGNVGDAAAVACVYAAFHVLCMLGCLGHTACAVSGSLQQAYQTAARFAQQTSIAHCCAWQCRRCCCCGLCLSCISHALHAGLSWSHCMCCVWILAGSISDSRMLCTANKHCSLLCMAMSEMLLLWPVSMLHFTCYACWAALVTLMCCGWILAASISDSRTLCTADKHCSQLCMAMLEMLLLWPVSMLHFTCSACWAALVTLHVLCLDPCSKHIRQQHALHSRQALLSAVHGNAGDAAAVACVYAAFHLLCMLGCLGHTANAVSGSLQQAYQTAECFAQQTSIDLSCAWHCWRWCCCGLCLCCISCALHAGLPGSHCMCCVWFLAASISDSRMLCTADKHCSQLCMAMSEMVLLWPVSMLHFMCSACWAALVTLHVLCLVPCSKHIRQQNALHSKQALLTAVHGNVGDAAAVACVYAAFHMLCMLGCLGRTACAVSGS